MAPRQWAVHRHCEPEGCCSWTYMGCNTPWTLTRFILALSRVSRCALAQLGSKHNCDVHIRVYGLKLRATYVLTAWGRQGLCAGSATELVTYQLRRCFDVITRQELLITTAGSRQQLQQSRGRELAELCTIDVIEMLTCISSTCSRWSTRVWRRRFISFTFT